jgi:hypothetical protein
MVRRRVSVFRERHPRARSVLAWVLATHLVSPAPAARAAPADGSTLASERGVVSSYDALEVEHQRVRGRTIASRSQCRRYRSMTPEPRSPIRAQPSVLGGIAWSLGLPDARSLKRGFPARRLADTRSPMPSWFGLQPALPRFSRLATSAFRSHPRGQLLDRAQQGWNALRFGLTVNRGRKVHRQRSGFSGSSQSKRIKR